MSEQKQYIPMSEIPKNGAVFFRVAHSRHGNMYQPDNSPKIPIFFQDNRSKLTQHPLPERDTDLPAWLNRIGLNGKIEVEEGVFLRVTFPAKTITQKAKSLYTTPEKFREFLLTSH